MEEQREQNEALGGWAAREEEDPRKLKKDGESQRFPSAASSPLQQRGCHKGPHGCTDPTMIVQDSRVLFQSRFLRLDRRTCCCGAVTPGGESDPFPEPAFRFRTGAAGTDATDERWFHNNRGLFLMTQTTPSHPTQMSTCGSGATVPGGLLRRMGHKA